MEKRETSGLTIKLIVDFVRNLQGDAGVQQLLELAKEERPLALLENARVWSSYQQRVALFDAAAAVTGDPEVARRIGAFILQSHASVLLRSLLLPLRTPAAVLRALPMVHAKLDTTGESRLADLDKTSAVISYRLHEGYVATRHDCLYIEGLFSQLPPLFGMPPARVSQLSCQLQGAEACLIEGHWRRVKKSRLRPHSGMEPADFARLQLDELESTLADLIRTQDTNEVLEQLTHRAGSAVAAQRLLLAVALRDGEAIQVHTEGIPLEEAEEAAPALLTGDDIPLAGAGDYSLRSEVKSSLRQYGAIAAFSTGPFGANEQSLLDAYARLAATALDTRLALDVAHERRRFAELRNTFSRNLIDVGSVREVAAVTVAAAAGVTGVDRSVLFAYDEELGALRAAAHAGYPPELADALDQLVVKQEDTPELANFLQKPVPNVYDENTEDEYVASMLSFFDLQAVAIVPVKSDQRIFGMLVAGWQKNGRRSPRISYELIDRFAGIADQAASSWSKVLLHQQVHEQATTDPLTGLANRRAFTELLTERLSKAGGPRMAVLFCDLDRFKGVNDALGHAAGDDLLEVVGRRLKRCIRSDDLVARLGGDEFTVLLTDIDGGWSPSAFAEKVRGAMRDPIEIEGSQVVVHLSIGAVEAVPGESTVREVLRNADAAMYAAKSRGGDRLLMFDEGMLLERSERVDIEASLAQAVGDLEQFRVLYQPQVNLGDRRIVAAEALVRWEHPSKGLLTPDRFLRVAEDTGLIVPIDLHVMRTACTQAAYWRSIGMELKVAVNFSVRTLSSKGVVNAVREALQTSGLPGSLLEIELTESAAITDTTALAATLLALSDLGISVAIDDVGTGFSSLALLYSLPAQCIKIDRSFVNRIADDSASRSVVEAVMLLAGRLGQSVVAEGIETVEQESEVRSLGCDLGQGYLFSRPVAPDQITVLARRIGATSQTPVDLLED